MTNKLPELSVYETPTSLAQICEDQTVALVDLISFATSHYGEKMMRFGDGLAEAMNARMSRSAYAPYIDEIKKTAEIISLQGVKTLQHSFTLGCSTIVCDKDRDNQKSPTVTGMIDWEQVGEDLASVVSLAVLENPIKPQSPIVSAQIGPAAFGLVMMNSNIAIKVNRAPIPNTRNKNIDLSTISEEDYKRIKARNNLRYSLKSVANQVMTGRPSCAYLLRHAVNLDMNFEDTLDMLVKTKTCDFGIMTLVGKKAGQAVTIEKHSAKTHTYSGYEAAANHWHENSPFSACPSLPRTLNSKDRAQAIADENGRKLFLNEEFSFAKSGVVDNSTRIMVSANPSTGEISVVSMHGDRPTSKAVSANFDGQELHDVRHYDLEANISA